MFSKGFPAFSNNSCDSVYRILSFIFRYFKIISNGDSKIKINSTVHFIDIKAQPVSIINRIYVI